MANGIKALRQIQMSREASAAQGTSTTDYTVWRGVGTIEDAREQVFPVEDIGIFAGTDRQYFPKLAGSLSFDDIELTYEQVPHILDAGIYRATPTTDVGGSGYIRTYTWPIQTSDALVSTDLQTYSFKGGDNNEVEKFSFAYVVDFALSGAAGEAWKMTANWAGREITSDSDGFVTVTVPAVEEALFSKSKLYLDATSDAIGNTLVSDTLLNATLSVTTGWQGVHTASGRADFSFIKQVQPEIKLDVTFEHNATATNEKANWRNSTARQLQIRCDGSALATAGAVYTYKALILNLAGKWDNFEKIDEVDGNDVVTGHFIARYNSTSGRFAEIITVNEVAAIP